MDELNQGQSLNEGDVVTGKVVKVEEKHALVDIGYKAEGILPISELSNLHVEKISDVLSEGDEVSLKVKKIEEETTEDESEMEIILSKRLVDAEENWEKLENRLASGEVFEAEIKEVVKGGLVADVGLRGFIPASHVETHYVENFDDYKGKTLTLKVIETDREKNRVIVSHKAVEEEKQEKEKMDVLEKISAGDVLEGTVQRLTDFGAFVDIGGIDGLVHISQLSHEHVNKASDVLSEGETVKVKVLSVDRDNERISLSVKDVLPGPWEGIESKVKTGDVVEGTVKRLVNFGAFVEVLPGVEGLVHISQISDRHIGTPGEVLEAGQKVNVKVLDVSEENKKMSLSIREVENDQNKKEIEQYTKEQDQGTFSLGDVIGDQLGKLKE
ncbi:30S ribosomal protein S1 [Virgibacillus sp. MSP4-1]|uniref:30S ribosomal protein S1 n=1 Tax=Virgibacillus sp. MSP4-1 TaxID=2700081 RepID=UPI0003A5751D|nr:30S ribosomal protein S1 [Virgibacillus sp. MSP4-1]QHS22600.1 30S ribosomal protein S1 [Virgibacillus sp. MSP4-1]